MGGQEGGRQPDSDQHQPQKGPKRSQGLEEKGLQSGAPTGRVALLRC